MYKCTNIFLDFTYRAQTNLVLLNEKYYEKKNLANAT